jgi:hypothetical protein
MRKMNPGLNNRTLLSSALIIIVLSVLVLGTVSCGPSQPSRAEMMNIVNSLNASIDVFRKTIEADENFMKNHNAVREIPASRNDAAKMDFAGGSDFNPLNMLNMSQPVQGANLDFSSLQGPYENKSKEAKAAIDALAKKFSGGDPQVVKLVNALKDYHKSCDSFANVAMNPDREKSILNYIVRYRAFRSDNAKQYALFAESLKNWNTKETASKWNTEIGIAEQNVENFIGQGILDKDLAIK